MGIVSGEGLKTKQSNIIQNTLVHPKTTNVIEVDSNGNIIDGGNTPTPTPTPDNTQNTKAKYSISGVVWIDADENGRRDNDETLKDGVEVLLYDVTNKKFVTDETGKVLSKKTDKDGKYSFTNIYVGQYYVVFKYDTDMYGITDYQRADVLNTENNDAVEKYARIFDETRTIGMTDTINLNSYKNNIDLGLVEKKNFDLKLEQYIQKITVTNSKGTKEYNYNNKKFAKISIHSKQFVGSTVVVEYKVLITNVGELTGKVYEILDQIPSKMDFHSEINDGWTKSLSYTISNISFVNNEIKPLYNCIGNCIDVLKNNGRLAVITFHSLEDRAVKNAFIEAEGVCKCPKDLPYCVCGAESKGKIITKKPILPTKNEQNENSRAKSAKLRVFEKKI